MTQVLVPQAPVISRRPRRFENLPDFCGEVPRISAPSRVRAGQPFEVTISVLMPRTPPGRERHQIECLELRLDGVSLAQVRVDPRSGDFSFTTLVTLARSSGPLRAYSFCNLHGAWMSEKDILVF